MKIEKKSRIKDIKKEFKNEERKERITEDFKKLQWTYKNQLLWLNENFFQSIKLSTSTIAIDEMFVLN